MNSNTQNESRAPDGSRSIEVILFALGICARVAAGPAPGPVVVRVARELGLSEAATRATILRLRRQGSLTSHRSGRRAAYAVAAPMEAIQDRARRQAEEGPPAWDGVFSALLHDFPEPERHRRDALRLAASLAGYGVLRPGLLVCPFDRWSELAGRFGDREAAGRILRGRLELPADRAREVAARIWQLDRLSREYSSLAARTDRSLKHTSPAPRATAATLRRFAAATMPLFTAIGRDPALPAALLPEDWAAPEVGAALGRAVRTLGPPAVRFVAELSEWSGSRSAE